jgi:hypothetical protein
MQSLTWANDAKKSRLAPASNSVTNMEVDGVASALNFKGLNIFNTWFLYNNQTWVVKVPRFDGPFIQLFIRHPTWFLQYWELFYINSLNYWSDFGQYLARIFDIVDLENYEPNFQVMGNFGETEKLFSLNLDPFSDYILLADFTNHFYNVVYDLYLNLSYELNLVRKSYRSLNFEISCEIMAVNSNSKNSDFDSSVSDSEQFRKKLKRYLADRQIEFIDPGLVWYPIYRRKPGTNSGFRSDFFEVLKAFLHSHRDLILPGNTDDLLLSQIAVSFDIEVLWLEFKN